jgi:quercetin dioxygenase-like cupin family protein
MVLTIGEYLREWRKWKGQNQFDIWKRGKALDPGLGRHAIMHFETGAARINIQNVDFVARIYEADVAVLMCFLQDGHEGALHLTEASFNNTHLVTSSTQAQFPQGSETCKAEYRLAPNRLADSNTMVVFLELGPRGHSKKAGHSHPGEEIMKVEQGRITLVRGNALGRLDHLDLSAGDILHFESECEHYIENSSTTEPAKVLIIRELHGTEKEPRKPSKRPRKQRTTRS